MTIFKYFPAFVLISKRSTSSQTEWEWLTSWWHYFFNSWWFIIVIGKTALFEPSPSLRDSDITSGFHFFGFFTTINFYRARSSALRPTSNMEHQVHVFMSRSDRVAQLYPQAPDSLFVAFWLAGLRWRYSNPPPHGTGSLSVGQIPGYCGTWRDNSRIHKNSPISSIFSQSNPA
jgi:hypothetical protein